MLALALLLDAALGEPGWLWDRVPHPVALMGRAIGWADRRFNGGTLRRLKGALALAGLALGVGLLAALAALPIFLGLPEVIGAAILLAHRSLVEHVATVAAALRHGLEPARRAVGLIVGRDPETLDAPGVARAAVESAAESFADGVVAPAFWFAVAGLPGIAVFKLVSTADSMIGHRTERHEAFGWAAARADDLMNWIPARLAALILCLVGGGRAAWAVTWRDARLHASPNAGWPEAAMAASLGLALMGPRTYDGETEHAPWLNADGRRAANAQDIDRAIRLLWAGWAVILAAALVLAALD